MFCRTLYNFGTQKIGNNENRALSSRKKQSYSKASLANILLLASEDIVKLNLDSKYLIKIVVTNAFS